MTTEIQNTNNVISTAGRARATPGGSLQSLLARKTKLRAKTSLVPPLLTTNPPLRQTNWTPGALLQIPAHDAAWVHLWIYPGGCLVTNHVSLFVAVARKLRACLRFRTKWCLFLCGFEFTLISYTILSGSVQSLSHVWLFATPWTTARQASLSITNSQSLLKFLSIESVMPSNHLILCRPLLFSFIW